MMHENVNGTIFRLAERQAGLLERARNITNARWRVGFKPTGSRPPKKPCIYHGGAIPNGSGPVAELKRTQGDVPREWEYLEIARDVSLGDDYPWVASSGNGWLSGRELPYARTGRALEWACGCITVYSRGTRHCKSGHLAGGDYHGREWVFACTAQHLEIYAGYAMRYAEPYRLEPPAPPQPPKLKPRGLPQGSWVGTRAR